MAHWSDGYLGIPYADQDCRDLVVLVRLQVFGHELALPRKERDDALHCSQLILQHKGDFARRIDTPVDGCGVLFLTRGRMAHIGLYCALDGGYVLHSDALFGSSTRLPIGRLVAPRIRIEGFYEWL